MIIDSRMIGSDKKITNNLFASNDNEDDKDMEYNLDLIESDKEKKSEKNIIDNKKKKKKKNNK